MPRRKGPQIEKKCTLCGETKPVSEFYSHSQKPHLFHSRCKICNCNKSIEARRKNPLTSHQIKLGTLRYVYGISWEQYQAMMMQQSGSCALCHEPFDMSGEVHGRVGKNKPTIDHCHETGTVRGILCGQCNRGLGFFRDSVKNLKKAIKYLERVK